MHKYREQRNLVSLNTYIRKISPIKVNLNKINECSYREKA